MNDPGDLFSDSSDRESEPVFMDNAMDENALLLGLCKNQKLDALYPQKDLLLKFWDIYLRNVNPLIKLIHVPSFQKIIDAVCASPCRLSKSMEAMLFAIYFSAVTSMGEDECLQIVGGPKEVVHRRYRIGVQQALVNAAFLKSNSIVTLQAYYTYLVSL